MKDRKFTIFGTTYSIKFVDVINPDDRDRFTWGDTDGRTHTIRIATKDINGKSISEEELDITVLHELMHVIFAEGQYSSCNEDEPLVEWCARCLHSFKKQNLL